MPMLALPAACRRYREVLVVGIRAMASSVGAGRETGGSPLAAAPVGVNASATQGQADLRRLDQATQVAFAPHEPSRSRPRQEDAIALWSASCDQAGAAARN
ncbi:hypothetical protein EYB53_011150 [Candidatus Chloroploca sp. M-50]|uniref:Uncharacterized protein n=1 Tax=Candidatus Chloroploca mongolica TaxID=2528176 RepID=A0ABS4DA03_9CHLR|nr:hypothetical protein [Candidatus Chloroploca mongolica]MBP1466262.1 hypothetical protein [Candidatus Chloroploca mongolica]